MGARSAGKRPSTTLPKRPSASTASSALRRHLHKALAVGKILHQLGGHISLSDTSSIGTYAFNIVALGLPSQDLGELNDRFDNKNADTS